MSVHPCDQCPVERRRVINETKERCPKCRLWICDECFNKDHLFCEGPNDAWLGPLRELAQHRAKEESH